MQRFVLALAIAIASVQDARGAPPLVTEDTNTLGRGVAQFEMVVEQGREERSGASFDGTETSVVLTYGLRNDTDLQLVMPYLRVAEETVSGRTVATGMLDSALYLKWRFLARDALSFAVVPSLILPTGTDGLSAGRVAPGALLVASYEPGAFALHADMGYRNYRNVLGQREDLFHVSASVGYTLHATLKLVADQSGETNPDPASSSSVRYTTIGAVWYVAPNAGLGCGVKLGHGEPAIDRTTICGLGIRR